jgi:hypothetical protein
VAERQLVPGERVWFADPRSPSRGLAVTSHPDIGVVVLSLWLDDRCTGTFQLPVADAPLLIAALTEGMEEGTPPPSSPSPSPSLLRRIK